MKSKLSLVLLAGIGSGIPCTSITNAAPVVYYNLNETGGTVFDSVSDVDMTPRTQTAAEFGLMYGLPSVPAGIYGSITVTLAQASAFGTAIAGAGFAENAQFINSTPNNALNTLSGSRTVTAWINPDSLPAVGRILSSNRVDIGAARTGWGYGVLDSGFQRFTTYGRKDFNQATGAKVQAGVWQHVAFTYAETSSARATVNIYHNGSLVETITGAPTDAANPTATFGLFGSGNGTEAFAGTIDDVWVFNEALSEQQIRLVATGSPIPEPSSAAAFGLAGVLALSRRRRRYT